MKSVATNGLIIIIILFSTCISCTRSVENTSNELTNNQLMLKGDSIAQSTFLAIRGALMNATEEGGIENAINYCKLVAIPITDSLSKFYDVEISRISDRNRNPINAATEEEVKLIDAYRTKKSSMGNLVLHEEGKKIFYKPIITQAFCLNCHGTLGKELSEANLKLIQVNYPDDKATGYAENEVRGLWRIAFESSK